MCATDHRGATSGGWDARPARVPEAPANSFAGFWIRFAATLVDAIILYGGVRVARRIAGWAGVYLPFELTWASSTR